MLRLSKKTWLALEAVVDVAINARPDPVQSKEITKRQGIPQRYLEQVMQQLVHAGILKGVRGPRGGYTLARERRRIAVGEVVRVVGAMEASDEPTSSGPSELGERVIAPLWEEVQRDLMEKLDGITVEDLCRKADEAGVGNSKPTADFTI
ncbi:MAG: Rrf2 family transcriptional regulator [Parvibaculum sp.]|uniref:RrF2 family transcriptional regulator n=1 Tax=Parvibaculum sp. TaxID=2024848 RepID=UPI001D23F175|nr:Rrf2 family transcriptional regulator [Parvibaculum sp.]MBX3489861.1 Rrf2 family transcriptional regulator [Parvibaculum sp.]MBX3494905.1 Rrf2 family transcriptional regulator [Parvibaculum sp.]MCW5726151.1 Rrf2 family transcriptional regulator [Parvibaculum sp.]